MTKGKIYESDEPAPIYNQGEDLRKSLIDVGKAYSFVEDFKSGKFVN